MSVAVKSSLKCTEEVEAAMQSLPASTESSLVDTAVVSAVGKASCFLPSTSLKIPSPRVIGPGAANGDGSGGTIGDKAVNESCLSATREPRGVECLEATGVVPVMMACILWLFGVDCDLSLVWRRE